MRTETRALMALTTALCLSAPVETLQAGDRPIKIVLAFVSPDIKVGATCQSSIASGLHKGDTAITSTSKTAITGRLGLNSKTFDEAWFELPDKRFQEGLKHVRGIKSETEDAVIIVSCEPGRRRVHAVVIAGGKTVTRLRFEHIEVDRRLLSPLVKALLQAAAIDFSP